MVSAAQEFVLFVVLLDGKGKAPETHQGFLVLRNTPLVFGLAKGWIENHKHKVLDPSIQNSGTPLDSEAIGIAEAGSGMSSAWGSKRPKRRFLQKSPGTCESCGAWWIWLLYG